jgi:DNA-binding transcriptional regulator WhiA
MEKYIEKAKVLTKYFGIYGIGNFDLSLEEIARIIELIEIKKDNLEYLDVNLQELYERLQTRLG